MAHATHTGLHNVKRKKNMLSEQLTWLRQLQLKADLHSRLEAGLQAQIEVVRREVRALHLADCYMRGKSYSQVEDVKTRRTHPDWLRVGSIIDQHGGPINRINMPDLMEWSCH
jgi:hypothetical protein